MPRYYRSMGEAVGAAMAHNARMAAEHPQPEPRPDDTGGECPAGLLPPGPGPVDRCTAKGPHDTHQTADGRRWTDDTTGA